MWIEFPTRITQTEDELLAIERRLRHQPLADRVKRLRLLKTRTIRSLRAAAPRLGSSERHTQRWWATYKAGGVEALGTAPPRKGARECIRAEALGALQAAMQAGHIARLREAQTFLRERFGIVSHRLHGISQLFKRQKIKRKTGRRRHRQHDPEAHRAFKKCLRRQAGAPPGHTRLCHG